MTSGSRESDDFIQKAVEALMGGANSESFSVLTDGELFGFGIALIALERGHKVARASWGNPGKYVFQQAGEEMFDPETHQPVPLKAHLVWKNDRGEFIPWTPSQDAVLAKDWFIGKSGDYTRGRPPAAEPIQN